ncbi:MAG: CheY-like chemotaxis protein [Maribacter sp.]|jgi:CheY-like chemotaxis protein
MIKRDYILYLEDDKIDAIRFSAVLKNLNFKEDIVIQPDGKDGIEWLSNHRTLLPKIIILDLNMPKMGGMEFLNFIKKEERFKKIPVIVLTSSDNKLDIQDSFENQVAGYMVKPATDKDYEEVICLVKEYWDNSVIGHF